MAYQGLLSPLIYQGGSLSGFSPQALSGNPTGSLVIKKGSSLVHTVESM